MKNPGTELVNFSFHKIVTEQFAIIEESYDSKKKVELTIDTRFTVAPPDRMVGTHVLFKFNHEKKPFMIVEVACFFTVDQDSWKKWFSKNTIIVPAFFVTHMVAATVGTLRGVLHSKTEGTIFNKYIIPPVDVTKLIKNDIKFINQIKVDSK